MGARVADEERDLVEADTIATFHLGQRYQDADGQWWTVTRILSVPDPALPGGVRYKVAGVREPAKADE